jgi:lysozyme
MALDQSLLDAIKGFEGYTPQAQWDYKQSSSGYGTKAQPGDENIPPDQLKQVHEQRFQDETAKAAAAVDNFAPNLPPGVRAALTSLTYNAGPGWQQSGLGQAVKSGDYDKAQQIFLQYNKAGGEVNPGLVARRQKEAAWFGGNAPAPVQTAQASPAAPPSAPPGPPMQLAPQQAPIFAPPVQQQQAQEAPPAFAQIPDQQAPPIFYPPASPSVLPVSKAPFALLFSREVNPCLCRFSTGAAWLPATLPLTPRRPCRCPPVFIRGRRRPPATRPRIAPLDGQRGKRPAR